MSYIIKQREYKTNISYNLVYVNLHDYGSGFSFNCDKNGNLFPLNSEAKNNYIKCVNGTFNVIFKGIQKEEYGYWEPSELKCDCGAVIILCSNYNDCECYRTYNKSGQELAPIYQWGEETGEHYSDCI